MENLILPKCPEPDADEFEQDSPSLPEAVYEKGRPQIKTQNSTDLSGDVPLSQGGGGGGGGGGEMWEDPHLTILLPHEH